MVHRATPSALGCLCGCLGGVLGITTTCPPERAPCNAAMTWAVRPWVRHPPAFEHEHPVDLLSECGAVGHHDDSDAAGQRGADHHQYVKNNEIVLNIGFDATTALKLGNEAIEFKARFGGTSRDIMVPVHHVIAIYARENGQGMAFPVPTDAPAGMSAGGAEAAEAPAVTAVEGPTKLSLADTVPVAESEGATGRDESPPEPPTGGRPTLKRIK